MRGLIQLLCLGIFLVLVGTSCSREGSGGNLEVDLQEVSDSGAVESVETVESVESAEASEVSEGALEDAEAESSSKVDVSEGLAVITNFNQILQFDMGYDEFVMWYGMPTHEIMKNDVEIKSYEKGDFEFNVYVYENEIFAFDMFKGIYNDIVLPVTPHNGSLYPQGESFDYGLNEIIVSDEYVLIIPNFSEKLERFTVVKDEYMVATYLDYFNEEYIYEAMTGLLDDDYNYLSHFIGEADYTYEGRYYFHIYEEDGLGLRVDHNTGSILEVVTFKDSSKIARLGDNPSMEWEFVTIADSFFCSQVIDGDKCLGLYVDENYEIIATTVLNLEYYLRLEEAGQLDQLDDGLISFFGYETENGLRCGRMDFEWQLPGDVEIEKIVFEDENMTTYTSIVNASDTGFSTMTVIHAEDVHNYLKPDNEVFVSDYLDSSLDSLKEIGITKNVQTKESQINIDGQVVRNITRTMKINGLDALIESYIYIGVDDYIVVNIMDYGDSGTDLDELIGSFGGIDPKEDEIVSIGLNTDDFISIPSGEYVTHEVIMTPMRAVYSDENALMLKDIIAKLEEAIQVNGEWYESYSGLYEGGQLPYHENFGISEEEYLILIHSEDLLELEDGESFSTEIIFYEDNHWLFPEDERLQTFSHMFVSLENAAWIDWVKYDYVSFGEGVNSIFDESWSGYMYQQAFEVLEPGMEAEADVTYGSREFYLGKYEDRDEYLLMYETNCFENDYSEDYELYYRMEFVEDVVGD